MIKYYCVHAKCGHVGRGNYYDASFFVYAQDGKEAAAVVRKMPRVKHDQKDAILSVEKISRDDYLIGRAVFALTPFHNCCNVQQQNMWREDIAPNVFVEESRLRQPERTKRQNVPYKLKRYIVLESDCKNRITQALA